MKLYDYKVIDAEGNQVSMKKYEGKVLLIVNTATECGYTPQYDGLQNLYEKYKEQGLEILDFPCNQFRNQAPGSDEEIGEFCHLRFGVTFPRFHKIDVNGAQEEPLFTYLKAQKGGLFGGKIKWNFTKFLVDRQGNVVARFSSARIPESIEREIQKLI